MDDDLELVKRYLTLISRIAARGASSPDPDHIRDTLFEVCFALGKYSGGSPTSESLLSPERIRQLEHLHHELSFIDSTSTGYTARDVLKFANTSTWN